MLPGALKFDPRRSVGFRRLVVGLTVLIGVTGFSYSATGLYAAGSWAGAPLVAWAAPVVIDGFIIVGTLAAIFKRSVGDSTTWAWTAVGIYTFISIAVNALHPLIEGVAAYAPVRVIVGAMVAALMPFSIWMATHLAISILVEKPEAPRETVKAQLVKEIEEERAAEERREAQERAERDRHEAEARQRREQARAEQERRQRQLAEEAEWVRIRDSEEAKKQNTDERKKFIKKVLDTYEGPGGGKVSQTAKLLGVTDTRVRQVVSDYEFADTSR